MSTIYDKIIHTVTNLMLYYMDHRNAFAAVAFQERMARLMGVEEVPKMVAALYRNPETGSSINTFPVIHGMESQNDPDLLFTYEVFENNTRDGMLVLIPTKERVEYIINEANDKDTALFGFKFCNFIYDLMVIGTKEPPSDFLKLKYKTFAVYAYLYFLHIAFELETCIDTAKLMEDRTSNAAVTIPISIAIRLFENRYTDYKALFDSVPLFADLLEQGTLQEYKFAREQNK